MSLIKVSSHLNSSDPGPKASSHLTSSDPGPRASSISVFLTLALKPHTASDPGSKVSSHFTSSDPGLKVSSHLSCSDPGPSDLISSELCAP